MVSSAVLDWTKAVVQVCLREHPCLSMSCLSGCLHVRVLTSGLFPLALVVAPAAQTEVMPWQGPGMVLHLGRRHWETRREQPSGSPQVSMATDHHPSPTASPAKLIPGPDVLGIWSPRPRPMPPIPAPSEPFTVHRVFPCALGSTPHHSSLEPTLQ